VRFVSADLTEAAIDMLFAYRRHCATNSSPGQLILPESLKLMPLYLAAATKLAAFTVNKPAGAGQGGYPGPGGGGGRGGPSPFADVSVRVDARVAELAALSSMPAARLVPYIYPRMYRVDMLAPQHGVPAPPPGGPVDGEGNPLPPPSAPAHTLTADQLVTVPLPPMVYPSGEQLAPHAAYLLDHRSGLFLIVGSDMDEGVFAEWFGGAIPAPAALPPGTPLPLLDSDMSYRLWTVITAIRARRPPFLPVTVVAPSDGPGREAVAALMAEDRAGSARSYVDLLCSVHTAIQGRMTAGS
jgi:protein transport protein SEC24